MKNVQGLLKKMIDAAEKQDRELCLILNKEFDDTVKMGVDNYSEYDNLRQSCVLSFQFFSKTFIEDAKQRYGRLYG